MNRWIFAPIVLGSAAAHAATFPPDASYVPWRCGLAPMTDPRADQPPALGERDLVGEAGAAAGLRASDAQTLYLRIRLDRDPAAGGVVQPFAWGMEFDLDGDLSTYELLITADGIGSPAGTVSVFTHDTTVTANDPADPADAPAAATFAFADVARTIAAGTTTGGDADFFLDLAIPWSTLIPLGLDHATRTHVWAGSSTVADALDGDLACFDGHGGAGRAVLDTSASAQTTGDPALDPTGDGGGGDGGGGGGATGELRLEGGSGCQAGGGLGLGALAGVIAALGLGRRRRRVG